jgi:hypothetical protein
MSQIDPKDPRFKVARRVTLGLYLTFACGFSCLIIYSVFKSVIEMSPQQRAASATLTESECIGGARELFGELDRRRQLAATGPDVAHADQSFLEFRVKWLERKRALEASCSLDTRPSLKDTFVTLEKVLNLYTTNSVQFAGGVGPSVDELKSQLGEK